MENKKKKDQMQAMEGMVVMAPSINLSEGELPAIKRWEVGKEYTVKLKVKQTSKSEGADKKVKASFEVLKADMGEDSGDAEE